MTACVLISLKSCIGKSFEDNKTQADKYNEAINTTVIVWPIYSQRTFLFFARAL